MHASRILPLISSFFLWAAMAVHADTLTVTNTLDDVAAPPVGSLRHVVVNANSGDTIEFAPSVTGTITLGGAELVIDKDLTVNGPGASALAVSGNDQSRVFRIPAGNVVLISGFTLRNGKAPDGLSVLAPQDGVPGGSGGAIYNAGNLTVSDCFLQHNAAGIGGNVQGSSANAGAGGDGGAVANVSGVLTLANCRLDGNKAGNGGNSLTFDSKGGTGGRGGAIFISGGQLTLTDSSITDNLAGHGGTAASSGTPLSSGTGGAGGGICVSGGNAIVQRCQITSNRGGSAQSYTASQDTPGGGGGGVAVTNGTARIEACTIDKNCAGESSINSFTGRALAPGSGIYCESGQLAIVNCTICYNVGWLYPGSSGLNSFFYGAGVNVRGGDVTLVNTIIAKHISGRFQAASDIAGNFVSSSHNLIGAINPGPSNQGATNVMSVGTGNRAGAHPSPLDPGFDSPTNGYYPLLLGSLARENGDDAYAGLDQRGEPRPAGLHVDIGAIEADPPSSTIQFSGGANLIISEGDTTIHGFLNLVRSGDTSSPASVQYTVSDGTATQGSDFTIDGEVSFPAGATNATAIIAVLKDFEVEPDETVQITLANPINATLGIDIIRTVTIQDSPPHANTLTVTNTSDDTAAPPPGSLRHAIATANSGDTIEFAAGLTGTITLAGAELVIDKNLTITGPGASVLAISGNTQSRIARIPSGKTVSVSSLTLRHGKAPNGPSLVGTNDSQVANAGDGGSGGAIHNEGNLTLSNCSLSDNTSGSGGNRTGPGFGDGGSGGSGGAIRNQGELTLSDCLLQNNTTGAGGDRTSSAGNGGSGGFGGALSNQGTVMLSNCVLQNNRTGNGGNRTVGTGNGGSGGSGGAIVNAGSVTMADCRLKENVTGGGGTGKIGAGGAGGAVMNTGDLTLVRCKFEMNSAGAGGDNPDAGTGGRGGAIASAAGELSMAHCIFQSNAAGTGGNRGFGGSSAGGNGGGISIWGGSALIERSTIVGNRAGSSGEGVAGFGWGGSGGGLFVGKAIVTLDHCTISGNVAGDAAAGYFLIPGSGGGVAINESPVSVLACTIVGNAAGTLSFAGNPDGGSGGDGGGIFWNHYNTSVSIRNSIIAANRLNWRGGSGVDAYGSFTSEGHNLIGNREGNTGFTDSTNGDLVGAVDSPIDPKLASLSNTGGLTPTHHPLPGSPALNAGDDSITGTDQRGQPRLSGAHVDIGAVESDGSATVVLSFASLESEVQESSGSLSIPILRTNDIQSAASVQFSTLDGSAAAGSEYTATSGTLNFAPGETQAAIVISIADDATTENPKTFQVVLSSPSANALINRNPLAVTIYDDDGPGVLSFATAQSAVSENSTYAVIGLVRKNGAVGTVSVSYATGNGRAVAGSDFGSTTGTVTFAPGVTEQSIAVPILNDSNYEGNESFSITLSSATGGATLGTTNVHAVIIEEDDPRPPPPPVPSVSFAQASSTVIESNGNIIIQVIRSGAPSTTAFTVSYQTSAASAGSGTDFTPASGTLTFNANTSTQSIVVPIVSDDLSENPETFSVTLSNPTDNVVLGSQATHTVTITDDDEPSFVAFSAEASNASESGSQLEVTILRSGNTSASATVQIAASPGTALGGSDYSFQNSTITFSPGVTQQTAIVSIINDLSEETAETLTLTLSSPTVASLGTQATHTVTILDDDGPAAVSFASATSSASESSGQVVVTVLRTGPTSAAAAVQIAATGGSALSGSDYTFQNTTVDFPPGVTERTVTLVVIDDSDEESDEDVALTLSNPTGANLSAQTTHTVTILDDVADLPEIRKANYRGLAQSAESDIPEFGGVAVKTTDAGRLTGTLRIRGKTLPLHGRFSENRTFSQEFTPRALGGSSGGNLLLRPDEDGAVLLGTFEYNGGTTFTIEVRREIVGTKVNPVPQANAYTALLGTQLNNNPAGLLRASVATSGRTSLSAILPDGTRLTASTHLTEDQSFPIFLPAYRKKIGYLAGPAQFVAGTSLPLAGELHWKKPADSRPPYADGFNDELVDLSGAVYTPPQRQRILDDFDGLQGLTILQLSGEESSTLPDIDLTWTERNAILPTSPNFAQARITLQPRTGLWSGSFRDPSGVRRRLHGICIQQPEAGEDLAAGFYIGETTSGRIELQPED